MEILIGIYLFGLGAIFGSFILVVVDRMKAGRDWVRGRSECEHCKHTLSAVDLIPIFSWLISRGKCRYCHKSLSRAYPLTELFLGLAFVISYLLWPYDLSGAYNIALLVTWLVALVIMAGLFVYDLRWFLLPNKLVYPLIAISGVWVGILALHPDLTSPTVLDYGLSLLVSVGLFFLLSIVSRGKWIGDGDIRLGVAIGLFTGSWVQSWLVIFIASIVGVLSILPSVLRKKQSVNKVIKMKIPFGPLLLIGLYIVVLFGTTVVDWYVTDILLL
jgi:leader peptidase (prepilin peptidase)/N-methyltransferase